MFEQYFFSSSFSSSSSSFFSVFSYMACMCTTIHVCQTQQTTIYWPSVITKLAMFRTLCGVFLRFSFHFREIQNKRWRSLLKSLKKKRRRSKVSEKKQYHILYRLDHCTINIRHIDIVRAILSSVLPQIDALKFDHVGQCAVFLRCWESNFAWYACKCNHRQKRMSFLFFTFHTMSFGLFHQISKSSKCKKNNTAGRRNILYINSFFGLSFRQWYIAYARMCLQISTRLLILWWMDRVIESYFQFFHDHCRAPFFLPQATKTTTRKFSNKFIRVVCVHSEIKQKWVFVLQMEKDSDTSEWQKKRKSDRIKEKNNCWASVEWLFLIFISFWLLIDVQQSVTNPVAIEKQSIFLLLFKTSKAEWDTEKKLHIYHSTFN